MTALDEDGLLVCGVCAAIFLREGYEVHRAWHLRIAAAAEGMGPGLLPNSPLSRDSGGA